MANTGKQRSAGILGKDDLILDEPGHSLNVIMGLDADGQGLWPAARRAAEQAEQEEESEA